MCVYVYIIYTVYKYHEISIQKDYDYVNYQICSIFQNDDLQQIPPPTSAADPPSGGRACR